MLNSDVGAVRVENDGLQEDSPSYQTDAPGFDNDWLHEFMVDPPPEGFQINNDAWAGEVRGNAVQEIMHGTENWAVAVAHLEPEFSYQPRPSEEQSVPRDDMELDLDQYNHAATAADSSSLRAADGTDRVCYGMVHNVDAKLIGDMSQLMLELNSLGGASPSRIQTFTLKDQISHVELTFRNGASFGHFREGVNRALSALLMRGDLLLEAVALSSSLCRKIDMARKAADALVQVDINIYGPLGESKNVGDVLTSHKCWLQRPDYYMKQYRYENPHMIRFPDIELAIQQDNTRHSIPNIGRRTRDDVMRLVSEVQASTHRAERLERASGDSRLQTELLEHQERALTFMLQRESGDFPEEFRLWKPTVVGEREMFVHRITKTRSAIRPEEKGGGILADEMGMGKSLSTLALISKTIDEGRKWAIDTRAGDHGHSGIKQVTHSTLVIVPSALLINGWTKEIATHLGNTIQLVIYHGHKRNRDCEALAASDIVLTTYKTLATDAGSKKSPLHSIEWFRVVLDEAHNIRRPTTTFYRSCANLHTRTRWCLTGTPIQNGLEDIGALFAFLKAKPLHNLAQFRRYLVAPFEQDDPRAQERLVMLYDSLVLKRNKDILELPGQEERVRELRLSPPERAQYNRTTKILSRYIRQQVDDHDQRIKFGLFQSHMQLRILCNHGTHQKLFSWKRRGIREEKEAFLAEVGINAERLCAGCRQPRPIIDADSLGSKFVENCSHILCGECLDDSENTRSSDGLVRHCPLCRAVGKSIVDGSAYSGVNGTEDVAMSDRDDEHGEEAFENSYFNHNGISTKLEALVSDVQEALKETVVDSDGKRGVTKSLIFSCWTCTLDLIEKHLQAANIDFYRIDGKCLVSKRQRILDQFSAKGGPRVMLMTTGTGAFGLNLTAANRIFIVELQWNPSVERQAIARAIRIRQKDKVLITRYLVLDTVEQEMQSQQVNKRRAAQAGFVRSEDG